MGRTIRNRRAGFIYYIYEGLRGVFIHKLMSIASITVIAACFLITGIFSLVAYNLDLQVKSLGDLNQIMLYIDEAMEEGQAKALLSKIKAVNNVGEAEFINKDQMLETYLKSLGEDATILEDLRQQNPMRHSFRIVMEDITLHKDTVLALEKIPGVASSKSEIEISDRLVQIRKVVNIVSYTLLALLGAVSMFIISNIIRIALFSRKEEIAIMKMVGATNHFIRAPFVIEGIFLGVMASLVAFLLQWGVYTYLIKELAQGTAVLQMAPFSEFKVPMLLILLGAGTFIGMVGSAFSIRRFLKV